MEEKIPDNNSIKKYLDKDKVDFNIKLEDKEEIFIECFKDINNNIIYDLCHNLINIEDVNDILI